MHQLLGRVRFDPERTLVQQHPGAADTDCWCWTLPSGTDFEAAPVSFLARAVPTSTSCTSSDLALFSPVTSLKSLRAGVVTNEQAHFSHLKTFSRVEFSPTT